MNRRQFLIGCGASIALTTLTGLRSFAHTNKNNAQEEIFVVVFLRGGCDALHLVGPSSDRFYADARGPKLRVNQSGEGAGLRLKNPLSDIDFRLHEKASGLKEIYDDGKMAIIHAFGLANGTRSHFEAMDLIERGLVQKSAKAQGWMTRYLREVNLDGKKLPAIASGGELPAMFLGSNKAVSIGDLQDFNLHGDPRFPGLLGSFYNGDSLLDKTARNTLSTVKHVQKLLPKYDNGEVQEYYPEHGAEYPEEWYAKSFSDSLKNLARLIKMEVGVHTATVDFGGWDTHDGQSHFFPRLVDALSRGVSAFYNDLNKYHNRLTVLVMSEFGRRLKANKSMGTDHGHGGVAMVLGGKVKGGRMYGQWPGLATHELDNGVDLKVTTDYRTVLGEILTSRLGLGNLNKVFPDFQGFKPLGFMG